jgi:hypothetical protein
MTSRIFVSHCAADHALGAQVAEFLRAVLDGTRVSESSLPGREPAGGADSLAAVKQELSDAAVVIGIITAHAFDSGEVPFQLGAAWALGKRLVLLLSPDGDARELYLPMGHAEALVLGPESLLELAASLAGRSGGARVELGAHSRRALAVLFPAWSGLDRESSEHPIAVPRDSGGSATTQQQWPLDENGQPRPSQPPPPMAMATEMESGIVPHARPGLPTCGASLLAGRAVSDCVFNREQGGPFADELDVPFGAFLAALGGNWSVLRELEDLDVWLEAADNVLETLSVTEQHVRFWYEIGFQLATLINLAGRELDGGAPADGDAQQLWQGSWAALRISAQHAGLEPASLEEVHGMLENLRGPHAARDYANLARVQERMRELANRRDASGLAVSA